MAEIIKETVAPIVDAVVAGVPTERWLVTMTSAFALPDGSIATHKATDYVAATDIDAYVADARTRWQVVTVAEKPSTIRGAYDSQAATTSPEEG